MKPLRDLDNLDELQQVEDSLVASMRQAVGSLTTRVGSEAWPLPCVATQIPNSRRGCSNP